MRLIRRWRQAPVALMALLWASLSAMVMHNAQAAAFKTDHVVAELVAEHSAVQPGQTLRLGLKLQHQPHWHTYWRNPGDSGLPTTVTWTLPPGAQMGEIDWPAPKRLPVGPLVNYGYEDTLLLPQRFTVPQTARPGSTLTLRAQASWLVCKDVCIPEGALLTLELPVVGADLVPGSTADLPLFDQLAAAQPRLLQDWTARLQHAGRDLLLTLDAPVSTAPSLARSSVVAPWPVAHVFPFAEQVLEPARHEVFRTSTGYAFKLALMDGAQLPTQFAGVVVAQIPTQSKGGPSGAVSAPFFTGSQANRAAAEFSAAVEAVPSLRWPEGAQKMVDTGPQGDPVTLHGGPASRGLASLDGTVWSWVLTVALAVLGGMLLNLMPCVFPVLSIKLLSVAQQQGGSAQSRRLHAAAYSLGVVLSFVLLAGMLLLLRAAGQSVGWGFQLQEPAVVMALALLFFALGLNLMGGFEWGQWLPAGLGAWRARQPGVDALASGVLAVVAASPCTAPFMGAALGFAVTQSAGPALLVFAALGVGMALPYAALLLWPAWQRRLPKPGLWMLQLKQLLAFPMFLTVVWLLWVLAQQVGADGAAAALLCLVALGFALWLHGALNHRAAWSRWRSVLALGVFLPALWWAWPHAPSSSTGSATAARTDTAWADYDPAQIDAQLSRSQPVFVDFTAAWCVSCQVNKRLVLDTEATQQAFSTAKVVLMRADWTSRNPQITEALARLGRNGVPVYVLYRPGQAPLLLPEVLTPGAVRDALATLQP